MSEAELTIKKVTRAGDNYYAILGIEKSAGEDEIKKAYRKLALRLHPDKCKEAGAEDAFKRINEAFSVLSDKDKRQTYDMGGVDALKGGGGMGGGAGGINPEDIFAAFFGGQGMPGGATFVQQGGRGGGFQTFTFSSGGPGMTFTNLGGGSPFGNLGGQGGNVRINGQRQRQAQAQREEAEARRAEQEAQEIPPWLTAVKGIAAGLGPLMPFAVMAMMFLGMMLFVRLIQFFIQRFFILLPIMYLLEGRTKMIVLSAVIGLGLLGII